ncbi:MAG TPA: hypothetical protein DCZ10_01425 [Pelotomaculum sp.]|nr:hypothetical protein [Pelotomaculum sp.]
MMGGALYIREEVLAKGRPYGGSLMHGRAGHRLRLNHTAFESVKILHGRSLPEAVKKISAEYGVAEETVRQDLEPLVRDLLERGFLIREYQRRSWYPDLRYPVESVTLHLTRRCNMSCLHCLVDGGLEEQGELSTGEWLEVVSQLPQLQITCVTLSGGEPLMRRDFFRLAGAIDARHIPMIICTNGTMINGTTVSLLKELNIKEIQVSLDGASPGTNDAIRGPGSFTAAIRAIRLLKQAGIRTSIAATLSGMNIHEYKDIFRLALELGVDGFFSSEILMTGRAKKTGAVLGLDAAAIAAARIYYLQQGRLYPQLQMEDEYARDVMLVDFDFGGGSDTFRKIDMCGAGRASFVIGPTGEVLPCRGFREGDFPSANVRHEPLSKLWQTAPGIVAFRNLCVDNFDECSGCAVKYECGGGCRAFAYALHGRLDGPPDPVTCAWKKRLAEFSKLP